MPELRRYRHAGPLLAASLLALSACGSGEQDKGKATAGGQILPGSASDAMLPLDTVRSQPPLAPRVEDGDKAKGKPAAEASAAAVPASEAAAEPAAGEKPAE